MEVNSHIITLKGTMVASKGMFMRNVEYITPKLEEYTHCGYERVRRNWAVLLKEKIRKKLLRSYR